MGLELEVKILDIDVQAEKKKILRLGGEYVQEVSQQLYTYDLPSIWGRYQEITGHICAPTSTVEFDVNFDKLKELFFEIDNLVVNPDLAFLNSDSITKFSDILLQANWIELLSVHAFSDYIRTLGVNPNKWVRLRKANNQVTLAVKHILADRSSPLQQLSETEISVSSFEEADLLLRQLGFVFKSYQEKRRMIFRFKGHEIDIDFWPGIPPYMEIEGISEGDLADILCALNYSIKDTVSCTADAVYRLYGKDMLRERRLTFSED